MPAHSFEVIIGPHSLFGLAQGAWQCTKLSKTKVNMRRHCIILCNQEEIPFRLEAILPRKGANESCTSNVIASVRSRYGGSVRVSIGDIQSRGNLISDRNSIYMDSWWPILPVTNWVSGLPVCQWAVVEWLQFCLSQKRLRIQIYLWREKNPLKWWISIPLTQSLSEWERMDPRGAEEKERGIHLTRERE